MNEQNPYSPPKTELSNTDLPRPETGRLARFLLATFGPPFLAAVATFLYILVDGRIDLVFPFLVFLFLSFGMVVFGWPIRNCEWRHVSRQFCRRSGDYVYDGVALVLPIWET